MLDSKFNTLLFRPAIAVFAFCAMASSGIAQPVNNFNNGQQLPHVQQFNGFNHPAFGNGLAPFNSGFRSPYASIFLQQRYNQQLANQYLFFNQYSTLTNPYWYFSPVVSQYGYYGNPWGTFPVSPLLLYGATPYHFVPGAFGEYLRNNAINPFGFPVNNPFAQQGPYRSGGVGAGGAPHRQNAAPLDPANLFK